MNHRSPSPLPKPPTARASDSDQRTGVRETTSPSEQRDKDLLALAREVLAKLPRTHNKRRLLELAVMRRDETLLNRILSELKITTR